MSGGVLVRMVFVQVVFVRGGFCPYTDNMMAVCLA